jgi:hypothetical protein
MEGNLHIHENILFTQTTKISIYELNEFRVLLIIFSDKENILAYNMNIYVKCKFYFDWLIVV